MSPWKTKTNVVINIQKLQFMPNVNTDRSKTAKKYTVCQKSSMFKLSVTLSNLN